MHDLTGKHALVCGASAGIGQAAAFALARRGAELTILARRRQRLDAMAPELIEAGANKVHALVADLDDRDALMSVIRQHLERVGPIHILVNNAGGPPSGRLLDVDHADQFLEPFGRHVLASHLLVRQLLPGMQAAGYGRIINVISTSVKEPIPNLGVSNVTRAAMAAWSKTLSKELPPGITINNVLPGYTDTERLSSLKEQLAKSQGKKEKAIEAGWLAATPEGRLGRPEELGETIAFLASPAAGFVRGQSLAVDGGRMASI